MPHRIVSIEADNVLRLKSFRLELAEKGLTVISGANEVGKSSAIRLFYMALGGTKYVPDVPIREGANKGLVVMDLDNGLIVTLDLRRNRNPKLTIKDGVMVG